MNDPLLSALQAMEGVTAKGVHLSPEQAEAVIEYIKHHTVSAEWALAQAALKARTRSKRKED
jgi:hypothetical protein